MQKNRAGGIGGTETLAGKSTGVRLWMGEAKKLLNIESTLSITTVLRKKDSKTLRKN